jgi:hypothetical protein
MKNQIKTIASIMESYDVTINNNTVIVQSFDTESGLSIYVDTENNLYSVSELEDINSDVCFSTEKFDSFEDLVDYLENEYC